MNVNFLQYGIQVKVILTEVCTVDTPVREIGEVNLLPSTLVDGGGSETVLSHVLLGGILVVLWAVHHLCGLYYEDASSDKGCEESVATEHREELGEGRESEWDLGAD